MASYTESSRGRDGVRGLASKAHPELLGGGHDESVTVRALKRATFTAHASGIPAPTVKWESSSNKGKTWTVIAKATSTTYTTARLLITESGREYRAVLTNRAGKTTSKPAKLTVTKT